jgi:transcriptional antiterminator NusG
MKPVPIELSPEVQAELMRPAEIRDVRNAQIVEGRAPRWYVIEVFASAQADVVKELVDHRFGVYVPEVDETVIRRGRRIERRVPMFAGYVFVFMWHSDQHWRWISDTPGVVEIVGWLPDADVDIVRAVENGKRPIAIEMPADVPVEPIEAKQSKKSKKKNRWKKGKSGKRAKAAKVITEDDLRAQIVTTRAWSAFDDILELDSEGRNQTLRKALGLT